VEERHGISWTPRSQVMSKRRAQFTTLGLCLTGIFMLFVALIVFSAQGSQLRVTATVLSEGCHPKTDLAQDRGLFDRSNTLSNRHCPIAARAEAAAHVPAEEQARRQGVQPIASADELAFPGVWESDQELEEFLADMYASRRAGTA
jgi:hypothetical protein